MVYESADLRRDICDHVANKKMSCVSLHMFFIRRGCSRSSQSYLIIYIKTYCIFTQLLFWCLEWQSTMSTVDNVREQTLNLKHVTKILTASVDMCVCVCIHRHKWLILLLLKTCKRASWRSTAPAELFANELFNQVAQQNHEFDSYTNKWNGQ